MWLCFVKFISQKERIRTLRRAYQLCPLDPPMKILFFFLTTYVLEHCSWDFTGTSCALIPTTPFLVSSFLNIVGLIVACATTKNMTSSRKDQHLPMMSTVFMFKVPQRTDHTMLQLRFF